MKYLPIGRITSAHGVKGEVKFNYYNEKKEVLYRYTSFFINIDGHWLVLNPISTRPFKGAFLIKFKGRESLEDIQSLIKKELFVRETDLPELEKNEYYDYQLIGMEVFDEYGKSIGTVQHVIHTGANDCLYIKNHEEMLIPMVEGHILSIDVEHLKIKVKTSNFKPYEKQP